LNARFENVSVESALEEITRVAGVTFNYNGSRVLALHKRVTLDAQRMTVRAALNSILRDTGLRARLCRDGGILITGPTAKPLPHP
jgi:hypothetical protein